MSNPSQETIDGADAYAAGYEAFNKGKKDECPAEYNKADWLDGYNDAKEYKEWEMDNFP